MDFEEILNKKVKPPINFKETEVNEDGFDDNLLDPVSNSCLDEKTLKEKGIGFDGFTYYKPEIVLSNENKESTSYQMNVSNHVEKENLNLVVMEEKDGLGTSVGNQLAS